MPAAAFSGTICLGCMVASVANVGPAGGGDGLDGLESMLLASGGVGVVGGGIVGGLLGMLLYQHLASGRMGRRAVEHGTSQDTPNGQPTWRSPNASPDVG